MKEFQVIIEYPTITITSDEIWPDHNGPDDPNAEDVASVMREYATGKYNRNVDKGLILRDWFPVDTREVSIIINCKDSIADV